MVNIDIANRMKSEQYFRMHTVLRYRKYLNSYNDIFYFWLQSFPHKISSGFGMPHGIVVHILGVFRDRQNTSLSPTLSYARILEQTAVRTIRRQVVMRWSMLNFISWFLLYVKCSVTFRFVKLSFIFIFIFTLFFFCLLINKFSVLMRVSSIQNSIFFFSK